MSSADHMIELKKQEWNGLVDDATKCVQLSQDEEIAFLSSKSENLAAYLKLHPEMAHELMVPSGFKDALIRRYERYLGNDKPFSVQNGAWEEAHANYAIFDALLPGTPKVISNLHMKPIPSWREVNSIVCNTVKDTISGEQLAPHFENITTGEHVRVIQHDTIEIEVTKKQWDLMWSHVVCRYTDSIEPDHIEFIALHDGWTEISRIPTPWSDLGFPIGQQIAILLKQLEHRLRTAHVGRPNPCGRCCPFRPATNSTTDVQPKLFLTKAEAARLVGGELLKSSSRKLIKNAVNYDPVLKAELERQGVKIRDPDPTGSMAREWAEWKTENLGEGGD